MGRTQTVEDSAELLPAQLAPLEKPTAVFLDAEIVLLCKAYDGEIHLRLAARSQESAPVSFRIIPTPWGTAFTTLSAPQNIFSPGDPRHCFLEQSLCPSRPCMHSEIYQDLVVICALNEIDLEALIAQTRAQYHVHAHEQHLEIAIYSGTPTPRDTCYLLARLSDDSYIVTRRLTAGGRTEYRPVQLLAPMLGNLDAQRNMQSESPLRTLLNAPGVASLPARLSSALTALGAVRKDSGAINQPVPLFTNDIPVGGLTYVRASAQLVLDGAGRLDNTPTYTPRRIPLWERNGCLLSHNGACSHTEMRDLLAAAKLWA